LLFAGEVWAAMSVVESGTEQLSPGVRGMLLGALGDEARVSALVDLAQELLRWNERINLTGYHDLHEVAVGLFLDSLALLPLVAGDTLLDIGSGAGFPGLVLALALPEVRVTLLEARGKRVSFQKQAVRLLGLGNVECVQGRAGEGALEGQRFDTVTVKAVAGLEGSLALAQGYLAPGGMALLPRGEGDAAAAGALGLMIMSYELPPPKGKRIVAIYQG
jgi:16S rRNA (guanine527-N7)-methyltransferase